MFSEPGASTMMTTNFLAAFNSTQACKRSQCGYSTQQYLPVGQTITAESSTYHVKENDALILLVASYQSENDSEALKINYTENILNQFGIVNSVIYN